MIRRQRRHASEHDGCIMAGTDDGIVSGDIDRGMRDAGRWSLLILRECFLRVRRFEEFQSRLGITRHLLADRLKKFVRYGVLRRARYQESPARYEYILTQRGLDLYPVVMSIVHWGDTHMVDERGRPLLHEHKNCGKLFDPVMICSECG
jgi:DNA-binding HxlR family transcriptional regulator